MIEESRTQRGSLSCIRGIRGSMQRSCSCSCNGREECKGEGLHESRIRRNCVLSVKRHRGEPGHTRAHGHTDEPHNHPNPPTHPSDRETTESAADSTAAAPEPTAPRGRLGGRPLRTRPSRPPLHRGEPDTLTRQTTPEPRDAHIATNHRTPLTPDQATHAPVQRGSHR